MLLYSDSYREITEWLMAAADDICGGRLVMSHEGGYSVFYVPFCGVAVMEALTGKTSGITDPFADMPRHATYQEILPHQRAVLDTVRASAERYWDSW